MSRQWRARVGYFLGVLLIAAGVGVALGYGWGLTALGAGIIAYSLLIYDVDEPEPPEDEGVRFR